MGRRRVLKEEGEHEVTISITIAKASEADFSNFNVSPSKKGKVIEAPKAQSYFHCSYKLLPDEKENVKTDVVTFGVAAKLYTDHDTRVLRPWICGEKTWVAWTNIHKIRVTREVLLKMFNHSMELKMWDAKEKVSPRARFDRPKAFKLPPARSTEESEIENIKKLIEKKPRETSGKMTPSNEGRKEKKELFTSRLGETEIASKMSHSPPQNRKLSRSVAKPVAPNRRHNSVASNFAQLSDKRKNPEQKIIENKVQIYEVSYEKDGNRIKSEKLMERPPASAELNNSVKVKVFLDENKKQQMANLLTLAANGISSIVDEDIEENDLMLLKQATSERRPAATGRSSSGKALSAERRADALVAYVKAHGIASVQVKLSALFTGSKSINCRLAGPVGTIEDLVITLTVDTPLLSEPQRKALNPMIIKVSSACNMPSKPLVYEELQERCSLPYISYKFHDEAVHEAHGSQHAPKIVFDDTHVILLGTKDKEKLEEYFRGPGLEIEVHDRDKNISHKIDLPTIFGTHEDDDVINKASLVTSRRTEHNPYEKKDKPWDPYGVARLSMSDLLLGEKIIELSLPIRGCSTPDVIAGRGSGNNADKIVGKPGSVDGPENLPIAAANYVEAGSELKVKVEVAYPIKTVEEVQSKTIIENPIACPFARLVCIFDYQDKEVLQKIQKEVTSINAETLQLKEFPKHVIEAALSTYKLTESQRVSKTLDILTGFQIIDGNYHIFVLEGLRDHGIKSVWNNLRCDSQQPARTNLVTLYNTDITFQERLYATLDVDLTRVRLHQPLDVIVKLPLLYVRDMVPRLCLQAVLKLHDLINCKKLRDAIRNEMFPTDEMIASLGREFGIPLTIDDLEDATDADKTGETGICNATGPMAEKPYKTTRPWTPLEVRNEAYEEKLKIRLEGADQKDFLAENIAKVQQVEPVKREATITCDASELINKEVHNYSIQSLNTTEMAKKKLRNQLSEDPRSRYTYSQRFNSATVLPIDPTIAEKEELSKSRNCWQTSEGFVFPGKKTSLQSNRHAMEPDFARLDELKKPWRENILHANKLKPTVKRVKFSWKDRSQDFDLLRKPKDYFGKPPIVTIHLAGDTLSNEQGLAAENERKAWEKSLVVDNPILQTYRCSTQTELLSRGFKSSSQVARLDDILRSQPRKHALSAPGLRLEKIPAFSVALNPTLDPFLTFYERLKIGSNLVRDAEKGKGFTPGSLEGRSWTLDKNTVPIYDYNHSYFIESKGTDFK